MSDLPYFEPLSKGVKIFAASAALLVVVLLAAGMSPAGLHLGLGIEVLFKLCSGWILFLLVTVPKIQPNYLLMANGLLGLLLGAVALDCVMRSFAKRLPSHAGPWHRRWTIAVTMLFAILFGICVCAVGIATHSATLFQEPLASSHPSRITILKDATSARQLYAQTNIADDEVSHTQLGVWAALAASSELDAATLNSLAVVRSLPLTEPPEIWTLLEMTGPVSTELLRDVPIFCSPRDHLPGKRIIGFRDGTARACTVHEYEQALDLWHAVQAKSKLAKVKQKGEAAP